MYEVKAKSNFCRIYWENEGKESFFCCGCVVRSTESLKIATSVKIKQLPFGKVFGKFEVAGNQEIKSRIYTEQEGESFGPEDLEIAYYPFDETVFQKLPDGFCKAENLEAAVDDVVCCVPVFENFESFQNVKSEVEFYDVVKDQGKCSLQKQLGSNKQCLVLGSDFHGKHLKVLGSPILSSCEECKFLGIVDFLEVENDLLLRLIYHGIPQASSKNEPTVRQETVVDHETDGGRTKLSTADPLARLWKGSIDFRDEFSKVLDVCYSDIKYWPHLAQEFGIDEAIYKAFSKSDIVSPTESVLDHLETTRPNLSVKDFCAILGNGDAHEVLRVVKKSVEGGRLFEGDLVSEICDKAPTVLNKIILKLDRDDKLWKKVAQASEIPKKTYLAFKADRTDNPTRHFFDILGTEAPELTVKNFVAKLEKLKLENVKTILDKFKIENDMLLKNLSKHPDAKSGIESILNQPKTDYLWKLASLYQTEEGLMQDIDIETIFRQQEDVHSPTCEMMEHVLTCQPTEHTIENLIIKLIKIRRKDCLIIIEPYLKGGKPDIDKITEGFEKLVGSSDVKKQAVHSDEDPTSNGVAETTKPDESDQQDNPYLLVHSKT